MLMSPAQNSKRKLDESCKTKLVKKLNRPTFSMIYIIDDSKEELNTFGILHIVWERVKMRKILGVYLGERLDWTMEKLSWRRYVYLLRSYFKMQHGYFLNAKNRIRVFTSER